MFVVHGQLRLAGQEALNAKHFVVHGQLRLAGQEALNAKHSQPPSLKLIKVALRA